MRCSSCIRCCGANNLVGTDLVQAVPLVAAAAGHLFFGDLRLDLTGAMLLGSIPGVLLGARLSSRAPAGWSARPGGGAARQRTQAVRPARPGGRRGVAALALFGAVEAILQRRARRAVTREPAAAERSEADLVSAAQ